MASHWRRLLRHLNDPRNGVDPVVAARAAADIVLHEIPVPPDLVEAVMSTAATTFAATVTAVQARNALEQAGLAPRPRPGTAN